MLENVDLLAFGELWSQFSLVLATLAEWARPRQPGLAGSLRLNDLRQTLTPYIFLSFFLYVLFLYGHGRPVESGH